MTTDEIRRVVFDALTEVAPEVDPSTIDPSLALTDQIDLDSMDFLAFLTGIAERTGIEVPEADYSRVGSLDGCVAYLAAAPAVL